jgi:hypothetical protein
MKEVLEFVGHYGFYAVLAVGLLIALREDKRFRQEHKCGMWRFTPWRLWKSRRENK